MNGLYGKSLICTLDTYVGSSKSCMPYLMPSLDEKLQGIVYDLFDGSEEYSYKML